ncbi:DUF72 domain-containing protein [Marinilactibacillus psychrotolerans]|uniref:DUF72 domain-containing protein n=2 Tax=Marinilactibacillus psychrotolerans TaxID=191770 RepID=A0A1R4JPT3_9LACT|nr:DUF72 domain-containing protein [Marinilactibacillus psychrotolerans]SJN33815.1 hypothetical protein FM115_06265 [Marinilactibacillus psychrotolerans 42ea]
MMITIGLTGWGDHPTITLENSKKLENYSSYFPVVELDTSFYAIPPQKNISSWIEKTPEAFQFIPKAYKAMTQHKEWIEEFSSVEQMFEIFNKTFEPMVVSNKVKAFLFQFPPYFDCTKQNVAYLRRVRELMKDLPVAIEFRSQSWFTEQNKEKTLDFLLQQHFINVIVDQPQTPNNSVPTIPLSTNDTLAIYRLHGRNYEGWLGESLNDWRAERTLYNYKKEELVEFATTVETLESKTQEVCVIFNNNSGGHAAQNAFSLQDILDISFENLSPRQLDLF